MADKDQLHILKQGVAAWNAWRQAHPDEHISLSGALLIGADLRGAILNGADLSGANLGGAHLIGADLSKAHLIGADLSGAHLIGADVRGAYLIRGDLRLADLREARMDATDLRLADLREANLSGASLREADLRWASLIQTNLSQAAITGMRLYDTARDNWKLDGLICDYVFFDYEGDERTPKDRHFRPGEFEELYKQLPTFQYPFGHGFTPLDAVVMSQVVEMLNAQHPEFELHLDSLHVRGQPYAKLTVLRKEHLADARQQVAAAYAHRMTLLEGKQAQIREVLKLLGSGKFVNPSEDKRD